VGFIFFQKILYFAKRIRARDRKERKGGKSRKEEREKREKEKKGEGEERSCPPSGRSIFNMPYWAFSGLPIALVCYYSEKKERDRGSRRERKKKKKKKGERNRGSWHSMRIVSSAIS